VEEEDPAYGGSSVPLHPQAPRCQKLHIGTLVVPTHPAMHVCALTTSCLSRTVYQEDLNPLEVSIEEIDKRVEALQCELDQKPPNIKTLQHVLQGSALPRM
jgi:hypothetical protein